MELKNIDFRYENTDESVIENMNLKVDKGMFLSILGENGSAKSTLVKLMLGLLSPKKGEIKSDFKSIGYVPQKKDLFNPNFPITVEELLYLHKKTSKNKSKSVDEVLELVKMMEYRNRRFGDLSGGQMQRVLIARAVLSDPDLIILDEPLTGVDKNTQEDLKKLLKELNKSGVTVISIEHDIAFALHNSTHILTMREGKGNFYSKDEYLNKIGHDDQDNLLYHLEVHSHA